MSTQAPAVRTASVDIRYETTVPVSLELMIMHSRSVVRGSKLT